MNRRDVLKLGMTAGVGAAMGCAAGPAGAQSQRLAVLSLQAPAPRPPGVSGFAGDLMSTWQTDHDTAVDYAPRFFAQIADETTNAFSAGYRYDVLYNWGRIPEVASNLVELGPVLSQELIGDLAPSQGASVSWQGTQYGLVPTLSPMLLFYNRDFFQAVGIDHPPTTWDEMKTMARAASGEDHPSGLVMPYGAAAGIGGVASVWMAFLQQAGGRMYDDDGRPAFNDAPGVDALQFMIDLLPNTVPESLTLAGYDDVAASMTSRSAAMTFSFPAFWDALNPNVAPADAIIRPAVMPNGPENNATINGVDAWTIAAASPNVDLSRQLIEFYLSPEVQKRQAIETGWLPARLSVLGDADVQAANAMAAVVLEQVKSPFESFVTPNYLAITDTIGREIQKALRGEQSAADALGAAEGSIQPLITW